jgi:L-alanine-DL-glutamate epimerase-like enolase superfamily enzyme
MLVQILNADAKNVGQIDLSLRRAQAAGARGASSMPLAALACLIDALKASVLRQEFAKLRGGVVPRARCGVYVCGHTLAAYGICRR